MVRNALAMIFLAAAIATALYAVETRAPFYVHMTAGLTIGVNLVILVRPPKTAP